MRSRQKRLLRLGRAQGELVRSLELKLAQSERKAAALSVSRSELDAMASEVTEGHFAFLPTALRKLIVSEAQLNQAMMEVDLVRRQLLAAKSRRNSFDGKARLLLRTLERKAGEEDALETTLAMGAKASRKHDVLS